MFCCGNAVAFVLPRCTAVQHIAEQDAAIRRLRHAGNVCPIEALAVLRAHKRGIDQDRLHTEFFGDLFSNRVRHGFVVLIQKVIGPVFLFCNQIVLEQFPSDTGRLGFPVFGLRDTPMCAGTAAQEKFQDWQHLLYIKARRPMNRAALQRIYCCRTYSLTQSTGLRRTFAMWFLPVPNLPKQNNAARNKRGSDRNKRDRTLFISTHRFHLLSI